MVRWLYNIHMASAIYLRHASRRDTLLRGVVGPNKMRGKRAGESAGARTCTGSVKTVEIDP